MVSVYQRNRPLVFERDGHKCRLCETSEDLTIHHVLPVSRYPHLKNKTGNMMVLCHTCHSRVHSGNIPKVNEELVKQAIEQAKKQKETSND